MHTGRTMHYSRGNTTNGPRRALITAYRPQLMIDYMRDGKCYCLVG